MTPDLPPITEHRRLPSPAVAPQALAWHAGSLWLGSRDLRRLYRVNPEPWEVLEEWEVPGIPWAAVSIGDTLRLTIGEGTEDDRYLRTFHSGTGLFDDNRVACPDFTGSYLSYDGSHLYLSQWYEHRILQLDPDGGIMRSIDVGAEICGHTFVEGWLYLLRGTEAGNESWRIARLDPREERPEVTDLAAIPFACRSLTHDGEQFWSNHRAAHETIAFTVTLPASLV